MIPVFRRFNISDYPTAPDWVNPFFNSLNVFAETTTNTLRQNLILGENVQGQKFTTEINTDGSSLLTAPVTLNYTGGGRPTCCILGQITKADGTTIVSPVSITDWFLNLNRDPAVVTIRHIAGLAANAKYTITLLVI
jgi:hypothetical protein